jgi:hypothetical protein
MTISFENDNYVIIYALKHIISSYRTKHYIFAAQCIWYLASLVALLQQGLIAHIDNLHIYTTIVNEVIRKKSTILRDHSDE